MVTEAHGRYALVMTMGSQTAPTNQTCSDVCVAVSKVIKKPMVKCGEHSVPLWLGYDCSVLQGSVACFVSVHMYMYMHTHVYTHMGPKVMFDHFDAQIDIRIA